MLPTDRRENRLDRFAALKAYEIELTLGPDAALAALGQLSDPYRMRSALAILIRAKRFREAADLISGEPLNEEWLDLAAYVLIRTNRRELALRCVNRADESSDLLVMRRTRVNLVAGIVESWEDSRESSIIATSGWSDDDRNTAIEACSILEPIIQLVLANREIDGDVQLNGIVYAVICSHVSNDFAQLSKLSAVLLRHKPVPLIIPELCLRGKIACPEGLPTRLRLEHPKSPHVALLAAILERDLLSSPNDAFDSLIAMLATNLSDEERESVYVALFETAGLANPPKLEKAIEVIGAANPRNTRLLPLLHVFQKMADGDLDGAQATLESVRDEADGVWWQARAQLLSRMGADEEASLAWEKASDLIPHPDVVRRSIQASLDRRKYTSAAKGLRHLLEIDPNDEKNLKTLARALYQLGDFTQAAEALKALVALFPSNVEYRMAYAQCLGRSAQIEKAIQVLTSIVQSSDAPSNAIMLQSELLEAAGQAGEAFELLEPLAADFWDDPRFLLTYMHRGHAAGKDELANEAFARLIELRRNGKVPEELMQEGNLEQLLEYGQQYQARRESVQSEVIAGRLPWLMADEILNNPAMWAWMLHTQPLAWLSEDRLSRAAYTVYATNGFAVCIGSNGQPLEDISASQRGQSVSVDLSALITLHQLGYLSDAANYFGKLLVPATYGDLRIRSASRFGLHQPSREEELRAIRGLVAEGRLKLTDADADAQIVDEHSDDHERVLRLSDVIYALTEARQISTAALADIRRLPLKPRSHLDGASLQLGARLRFDITTLRTIVRRESFSAIAKSFEVVLLRTQFDELGREVQAYEHAHEAYSAHNAFWDAINRMSSEGRIEQVAISAASSSTTNEQSDKDSEVEESEDNELARLSMFFDSSRLARQVGCPLLADDRVLQVITCVERKATGSLAFGTDSVLAALFSIGVIGREAYAAAFSRLMQWRYRFLVAPPELLVEWARQDAAVGVPGNALLEVAAYLHDCLRDPGLHCGPERIDPPIPMAVRFVTAWVNSIVIFCAEIWKDSSFTDDRAAWLTQWIVQELNPSCPRGLWYHQVGHNLSRAEVSSFVSMCLVQFATVPERRRANLGLQAIGNAFGMDADQYFSCIVEAMNATGRM